jgi:hypothetical protein
MARYCSKFSDAVRGLDGISVTHKWDGKILTITSASGTSEIPLGSIGGDGVGADLSIYAKKDDLNTKQDILVSGSNIKTINGRSLLGPGNLTVEGGGNGDVDLSDYVTKDGLKTINGQSILGSGDIYIGGGDDVDHSGYALKTEVEAKQDILISGSNIKTINGKSIVGSGDVTIKEGSTYDTIYTFNDAIMAWSNGEKFPIAFIGDSTFYGTNTSGDGYTFCDKLQSLLREEFGSSATIYRVAKAGAKLDHGVTNFNSWFGSTGTYKDTKMVGIGYGINDRLNHETAKSYYEDVYSQVETIVRKCFEAGIQPFIVTSQATAECGVRTDYVGQYPLRTAGFMDMCANGAKEDVARKYNISLIDYNKFSEKYMLYSLVGLNTIISDQLHFGNVGHAWAGGFFFSQINPRVIRIKNKDRQIITYAHQNIETAVPQDKITYGGDYKLYAQYTKSDSSNLKIMDFYIFTEDAPCDMCAYKGVSGSTYVSIDGTITSLESGETQIDQLEMGLHHVEVYTGNSTEVDFIGFDINANKVELGGGESEEETILKLNTPTVIVNGVGLASWAVVPNSTGYKYKINNGSEMFTEATSVQLELGDNIVVKAIGDGVSYSDSNYSVAQSYGTTVHVNNLNLSSPKTFTSAASAYPSMMAMGYDEETKTTDLSGAKIKSFILKSSNAGTMTFGTTTWETYGQGILPTVSKTRQVSLVKGNNTIDLSDLEIGADETLVIGAPEDTALLYYKTVSSAQYKDLFFVSAANWKNANMPNVTLQLIADMTYIKP